MKQKFTLTAILVLFSAFTFGQLKGIKSEMKYMHPGFQKYSLWLKKDKKQYKAYLRKNHKTQNLKLKSSEANKDKLDSLLYLYWENAYSQWFDYYKEDFTYDANENMTQYLGFEWDFTNNKWNNSEKEDYSYDENGNVLQYVFYTWSSTSEQWDLIEKEDYTYDGSGRITGYIYYDSDVLSFKETYIYDDKGNNTLIFEFEWGTSSQWDTLEKVMNTFDANGKMTESFYYLWEENNVWTLYGKGTFTYDDNGNLTLFLVSYFDANSSTWIEYSKEEYAYDVNGRLTSQISYELNLLTFQLVEKQKEEYTYDDNQNMSLYFYSEWDTASSQWSFVNKEEYTVDPTYAFSDLILPYFYSNDDISMFFNHKLTDYIIYNWNMNLNDWEKTEKALLYYSEHNVTNISEMNGSGFSVYPNPFNEYVLFSSPGKHSQIILELYDIQGKKVMSREIKNNENVSLKSLKSGMYFYILDSDGKKQSGKLLKQE